MSDMSMGSNMVEDQWANAGVKRTHADANIPNLYYEEYDLFIREGLRDDADFFMTTENAYDAMKPAKTVFNHAYFQHKVLS